MSRYIERAGAVRAGAGAARRGAGLVGERLQRSGRVRIATVGRGGSDGWDRVRGTSRCDAEWDSLPSWKRAWPFFTACRVPFLIKIVA